MDMARQIRQWQLGLSQSHLVAWSLGVDRGVAADRPGGGQTWGTWLQAVSWGLPEPLQALT